MRLGKKSGWSHGCDPPTHLPLGTSTHIEIRDVGGTFSVSFNGMVQCTTVFTGQVLPARTDYTSVTCAACSKTDELATQSESYSACDWYGLHSVEFEGLGTVASSKHV